MVIVAWLAVAIDFFVLGHCSRLEGDGLCRSLLEGYRLCLLRLHHRRSRRGCWVQRCKSLGVFNLINEAVPLLLHHFQLAGL